jgi:hypothetical protein
LGKVNEYKQTTAPVDIKLQGAQGVGVIFFCVPTTGEASHIDACPDSSWAFNVNCETAKHWMPKIIIVTPIARNNDRHMV